MTCRFALHMDSVDSQHGRYWRKHLNRLHQQMYADYRRYLLRYVAISYQRIHPYEPEWISIDASYTSHYIIPQDKL